MDKWKFAIAPMMGRSDQHCRYFWRLLSKKTRLYTEMITTGALLHGDSPRFLKHSPIEQPLAIQLGGCDPSELAKCSRLAETNGYEEVNLNCGCPSRRVQSGNFGASLMLTPSKVASCVAAMRDACSIPVTVKHRLGVDNMDSYDELANFVGSVAESGCEVFIVHARKALLRKLSPRENREIPPLNYPWVYRLKNDFPSLKIVLNGGINSVCEITKHLNFVDGVMVGRKAYEDPWFLTKVDSEIFYDEPLNITREDIIQKLVPYIQEQISKGNRLNHITRHLVGLFKGEPRSRWFRKYLAEHSHDLQADHEILLNAVMSIHQRQEQTLDKISGISSC